MSEEHKVLALIPARGGSKGVTRKNLRELGGKPLIAYSIEEAFKSRYVTDVIVSSDDEEILSVAQSYKSRILKRPAELAMDNTPSIDVVIHALTELQGYSHIVLLQPTSPFRTAEDIDNCLQTCFSSCSACVSVVEADKPPQWMYTITDDHVIVPLMFERTYTRRQDIPKSYALNGAVYAAEVNRLLVTRAFMTIDTKSYIMPKERSLDIDTPLDLEIAEFFISKRMNGIS